MGVAWRECCNRPRYWRHATPILLGLGASVRGGWGEEGTSWTWYQARTFLAFGVARLLGEEGWHQGWCHPTWSWAKVSSGCGPPRCKHHPIIEQSRHPVRRQLTTRHSPASRNIQTRSCVRGDIVCQCVRVRAWQCTPLAMHTYQYTRGAIVCQCVRVHPWQHTWQCARGSHRVPVCARSCLAAHMAMHTWQCTRGGRKEMGISDREGMGVPSMLQRWYCSCCASTKYR